MSIARLGRIKREYELLMQSGPNEGFTPCHDGSLLEGDAPVRVSFTSADEPYSGISLTLLINFTPRYPMEPPCINFVEFIPYHPNVDREGRICLDLLRGPPAGGWKPTIPLLSLLNAIRLLLKEPNPDDPLSTDAAADYQFNYELFCLKAKGNLASQSPAPQEVNEDSAFQLTNKLSKKKLKIEEPMSGGSCSLPGRGSDKNKDLIAGNPLSTSAAATVDVDEDGSPKKFSLKRKKINKVL